MQGGIIYGKEKNILIATLVAKHFISEIPPNLQINHKDGNKRNNRAENLEWVTASENIKHSFYALGKQSVNKGRLGKSHYAAKPIYQYSLDGKFVKAWDCVSDAAREIGCNPCQILNNAKGRNRTCHGYMWRYEKSDSIDTEPAISRKTHKKAGL